MHDFAGLLSDSAVRHLDAELEGLYRESGIDVRLAFIDSGRRGGLSGDAARDLDALGVGAEDGQGRGILFLYDMASQSLRIEVGYDLEEYFPDAFVGYLIHDNARYLFEAGEPATALELTVRMIRYRIRVASLGGRFDPSFVRALHFARYGSGGAGAEGHMLQGSPGSGPDFVRAMDARWRARFAAGASVEETYQRYVEWLAEGVFDPDVTLFSPETQKFLRGWPMTRAYFDYILIKEYGNRMEIVEAGDRALLYSTNDPFSPPLFFRLAPGGVWELDLVAGVGEIDSLTGGPYSWGLASDGPYASTFVEHLTTVEGVLRLARGDNRAMVLFQ